MAKIGLNNFRYGLLSEASDGTPTYAGAVKPGKAVSCTVDITSNDAKLFADDSLAESDTSFQSGTVAMNIDDDDITTQAALLGHTVAADAEGGMTRNVNDVAPYVGLGRIVVKMVNGTYKYKVEFLYKVKFSEPSQENNTKGESVEFGTTTINGVISALKNGKWSFAAVYDTQAAAEAKLVSLLGGTSL